MRQLLAAFVTTLVACGPKVAPAPIQYDEDLPGAAAEPVEAPAEVVERPTAPHTGKGSRTGTIARDRLVTVLDAGPASFLRQLEVAPKLHGERFVGWQLVQIVDRVGPLGDLDVAPGDVLLAINGKSIARPDQLQALWDSLRTANQVVAQLTRGDAQLTLEFQIEPKIEPKL